MEKRLSELVERLTRAHGSSLVSVMLYGSAAQGEQQDRFADLNVLCVLKAVTPTELRDAEPVFRWWRGEGHPAPLLLSEREMREGSDCFPIEFADLKEQHRVLHGENLLTGLEVETHFYRAQVEHEFRAKLLRLRQKAAGVSSEPDLLLKLMCDSVSTFCVLLRHAMRLDGVAVPMGKRPAIEQARTVFQFPAEPFAVLLDVREGKRKAKDVRAQDLFSPYLQAIESAVSYVNRLAK